MKIFTCFKTRNKTNISKNIKIRKTNFFAIVSKLGGDDEVESNAGAPPSVAGSAPVEDSLIWPSMQDLNTRLRRVITSYQRNYKKEELKQQQKAKVNFFCTILISTQQTNKSISIFSRSTFENSNQRTL